MRFLKIVIFAVLVVLAATVGVVALAIVAVVALGWMLLRRLQGPKRPVPPARHRATGADPVIDIAATEVPVAQHDPKAPGE